MRAPPTSMALLPTALALALACWLAACSGAPQKSRLSGREQQGPGATFCHGKSVLQRPNEYLDPVTAAMVASVTAPAIFARAHQDVAANSRQYATVVGVSVNRSGHYDYFLLVYLWSTVDPRLGVGAHPGDTLVLLADDRAIRMKREALSLEDAGIAQPPGRPPHYRGSPRIYRTDAQTLVFVSLARRLRLQLEGDQDARPFDIWKDGRRELGQLAALAEGR